MRFWCRSSTTSSCLLLAALSKASATIEEETLGHFQLPVRRSHRHGVLGAPFAAVLVGELDHFQMAMPGSILHCVRTKASRAVVVEEMTIWKCLKRAARSMVLCVQPSIRCLCRNSTMPRQHRPLSILRTGTRAHGAMSRPPNLHAPRVPPRPQQEAQRCELARAGRATP